ncbi:MAG: hypothetical protein HYY87_03295, partial [Candidatus Levybacteria bacterium]|nr:hypothetical protein [Candidatus Levybacteria bacterium]
LRRVEDFRRNNPNAALPLEFARIAALSVNLGVREQAGPCYLPTPPFPANTPCPAPGAAIPIASFAGFRGPGATIVDEFRPGWPGSAAYPSAYQTGPTTDKDGKPLVYGQGPKPTSAGVCSEGFHWMYDSGGWCMSNSGNYSSPTSYGAPTGPGYTPYSPYYTAPGVPPVSYGYPGSYPAYPGPYSPPSYWGPAPTDYRTNPPPGTVPGSDRNPTPSGPGQCPSGYHWMPPYGSQAGWCMADGSTYVPGGSPYSPNLNQSSCGPGYYWDGRGCIRTSPTDTYGSCKSPPNGCGSNAYWDYGSCSCRGSSTYSGGGSGPSYSNSCQGISCGSGYWLDYSSCSCRSSGGTGGSYTSGWNPSTSSCTQQSCGSGQWFDWATCSCRPTGNTYPSSSSSSSSTCTPQPCSGTDWFDSGTCSCRPSSSTYPSGGTTSGGGSAGCSCSTGYHCMDGSWCMQDGAGSTSSGGTTTPSPTPTSSEPAPTPTPAPTTSEPTPAPTTSP